MKNVSYLEKVTVVTLKRIGQNTDGLFMSETLDRSVTAHFQELKVKANPEEWND